jgi:hypothetical protein
MRFVKKSLEKQWFPTPLQYETNFGKSRSNPSFPDFFPVFSVLFDYCINKCNANAILEVPTQRRAIPQGSATCYNRHHPA